jgi:hypothetical protein
MPFCVSFVTIDSGPGISILMGQKKVRKVWTQQGPCGKFSSNTKKHSFVAKFGEKAVDRVPSFM